MHAPINSKLVALDFGLPRGTRFAEGLRPLWSGVFGGHAVGRDQTGADVRIAFGESFSVFYTDGNVVVVELTANGITKTALSPAAALDRRLAFVEDQLTRASQLQDEGQRQRRYERSYRELANMFRYTKVYTGLRQKLVHAIGRMVKRFEQGPIPSSDVRRGFFQALDVVRDTNHYWWLGGSSPAGAPEPTMSHMLAPTPYQGKGRKHDGKAERRERDRQLRAESKGPPRNDDSKTGRHKKK